MSDEHIYKNITTNQSTENAERKYTDKIMLNTLNKNNQTGNHNKTNMVSEKSLINIPKNFKPRPNNLNMIHSFQDDLNSSINILDNKGMALLIKNKISQKGLYMKK
jgi:hypothetical protein